ncbi:hypothetical protein NRB56_41160 [Nocardia sp. RB56]|uniref:DUF6542 domain-containing protein n=1 Tax=Nocardia aurantia TaxID=2585199 RepID=A0A7K0DT58_9NOCA|nr:hypothetical protein [Nocardia aurantia]
MPASHRSIIPAVPGLPAGAAVLVAVFCTLVGFFIDAGGHRKELSTIFAGCYIAGCLLTALLVRYRGLFTAMVTPPLLLFVAVPLAYQQLVGHGSTSKKDIILNLAIPLVNRFPLMALATVLTLAVGGVRVLLDRRETPRASAGRARKSTTAKPRAGASAGRTERGRTAAKGATGGSGRRRAARSATGSGGAEAPAKSRRGSAERGAERTTRVNPGAGYPRTTDRTAADRNTPDRAAGEQPQRRGRGQHSGDVPPHPRPNVRYRERDAGRVVDR